MGAARVVTKLESKAVDAVRTQVERVLGIEVPTGSRKDAMTTEQCDRLRGHLRRLSELPDDGLQFVLGNLEAEHMYPAFEAEELLEQLDESLEKILAAEIGRPVADQVRDGTLVRREGHWQRPAAPICFKVLLNETPVNDAADEKITRVNGRAVNVPMV